MEYYECLYCLQLICSRSTLYLKCLIHTHFCLWWGTGVMQIICFRWIWPAIQGFFVFILCHVVRIHALIKKHRMHASQSIYDVWSCCTKYNQPVFQDAQLVPFSIYFKKLLGAFLDCMCIIRLNIFINSIWNNLCRPWVLLHVDVTVDFLFTMFFHLFNGIVW